MPSFFKNPFKKDPKPVPPPSPPLSPPPSLPPSPQFPSFNGWPILPPPRRASSISPPRRRRRNSSPSPPRRSRPTIARRARRSPSPPARRPPAPSPVPYPYLSPPPPPPKPQPQPPSSFNNAPRHWVTPLPGIVPSQPPPQYYSTPLPKRPLTPPLKRSITPPIPRPVPGYWASQPGPPSLVPSRSPSPTSTIYTPTVYPQIVPRSAYPGPPSPSSSISSLRIYGRPPSPPVTPPTCPNCKSRPVATNPSGGFFDFCTKTCATQSKKASLCEHCKQRPKYKDGSKEHAYCGLTCAGAAANSRTNLTNPPTNPPVPVKIRPPPFQPSPSGPICQIPGCTLPVFVHPDGAASNYCMMTHKNWGERGCISCRAAPMSDKSVMCTTCHEASLGSAPMIIQVHKDHENFKSVEKQFKKSWRHGTQCPEVTAVYKIVGTEASTKQYYKYLDRVESEGNFVSMSKSRGNENRRWHGTKRTCYLGDQGKTAFCASPNCSLCCIIKTSFDLSFFKGATGWGRFGAGIYTSSTSSKSNDYSKNEDINSDWKALLLNKVVVGNGKKLIQDDTSLTKPPPTFHSVLAEVAPGGSLNYDELVVYTNDAVRPSYLVMYENPDVPRV